jgi:hypothetical protein
VAQCVSFNFPSQLNCSIGSNALGGLAAGGCPQGKSRDDALIARHPNSVSIENTINQQITGVIDLADLKTLENRGAIRQFQFPE